MFRPRNETEDLLLSFTTKFETLIKQTHTKPKGILEFNFTQPRETFSFKPSLNLGLDCKWMIRLTCLEVYNSFLNITQDIKKFGLYTDLVDEIHSQN